MNRRDFLKMGAGLPLLYTAGHVLPGIARTQSGQVRSLPALTPLATTGARSGLFEATLMAEPYRTQFLSGTDTEFWAYNHSVPGPLIDVREGDTVRIRFVNHLSQPSSIHWHGLPVPPDQDGNPMDVIAPGASRLYEFTLPADTAGTYWYHPHPHGLTHEQVYRGLAGMLIVRPAHDPIPAGIEEKLLFITDLKLDADGRIAPNSMMDNMHGREGNHLLVNGREMPTIAIRPGQRQRWRIANATNARYLRLALPGHRLTLIGTDGGLLERPVVRNEILLAPAQRVEFIITADQAPGSRHALLALPYNRGMRMGGGMMGMGGMGMMGQDSETVPIVRLAYTHEAPVATVPLPDVQRRIAPLGRPAAAKRVVMTEEMMAGGFFINGRAFNMRRVDLVSRANQVELWEIVNHGDMDHAFHLHGTQFQVVSHSHNGVTTPEPLLAWRDTVNVRPDETVRLKVVQNQRGKRMFHCHILEHEDQGMMGVLEVV